MSVWGPGNALHQYLVLSTRRYFRGVEKVRSEILTGLALKQFGSSFQPQG
jgi:hypothetical protein